MSEGVTDRPTGRVDGWIDAKLESSVNYHYNLFLVINYNFIIRSNNFECLLSKVQF